MILIIKSQSQMNFSAFAFDFDFSSMSDFKATETQLNPFLLKLFCDLPSK